MTGKTMITLRVQVTIPHKAKRPERVRVVVKERGALFFPFHRKLASIPLYKAKWRLQPGNLWQNEQAMAVPMNVPKLLRQKRLALQLYCLRGSSVKHKGICSFPRIMKQLQNDELLLAMRYPKCGREEKDRPVQDGSEERDRGVAEVLSAGTQSLPPTPAPATNNLVTEAAAATPILPEDPALTTVPPPSHTLGNTSCPTTDSLAKPPDLHTSRSEPNSTDVSVSEQCTDTPPPRRVRFPDSGSVFAELLREYDLYAAQIKAEEEAEKKEKEKARPQPLRELMWMNVVGAHLVPPLLVRHVVLDLHRDGIPRLYGDASLPVQALLWAWTGVTLCVFYVSCWWPAGWVREGDAPSSSQRRCDQCRLDVPRLAHHCSVCEACVIDRHHHSFLTGSCVGRDNARLYRLLCVLGAVGGLACATVLAAGPLLFGKDVLPKDWMVGGMAVALMVAGGYYAHA